jgi:DnaJ-class molecular chaperone
MADHLEMFKRERDWRHRYSSTCREFLIDENRACKDCGGSGYKLYGSTATWRGGVGGQMMIEDVCDKCWGSGDADRPWPSHRAKQKEGLV